MDALTTYWWLFVLTALIAALMTGLVRHYALSNSLMDVPNERSSHTVPTPRGGGVAIVAAFLLALPVLAYVEALPLSLFWALLGAGSWVALVGFLDDHGHIAARWRLLAHFIGAVWVLYWLGSSSNFSAIGYPVGYGWLACIAAAFGLVWLLNLYNFMDGIDGLASVEAICTCVGGVIIHFLSGNDTEVATPLLLASATLGFLVWNFPPARIFMGDAGSGFLGIILGTLVVYSATQGVALFAGWLILLGVFVVDASWTLLRRLLRGDRVYMAHRSHAYQHAARKAGRHLPVTLTVMLVNLTWLLPLAIAVVSGHLRPWAGILLAYLPLWGLAIIFKAGQHDGG